MNKKGMFVAIFSLFFLLALAGIYYHLSSSTGVVTRLYYTPSDVLINNFDVKEYYFELNQDAKYDSFKSFNEFCENGGFYERCEAWYEKDCDLNLENDFKQYFIEKFNEPFYDIDVKIENDRFVISGKTNVDMKFEKNNVRTELKPEFSYVLDYDVSIFKELYENCRDVVSCDNLGDCRVNKCSSDDNYINLELDLSDNGFIQPKIIFKLKTEELEG